jgi:GNAT superfamily N-acetyltransferase
VTYRLVDVENEADWHAYHPIRRSVLWDARGRSNYDDRHEDEYRPNRYPLLLKLAGRSIGTTRLDDFGGAVAAVRLVAIVSDAHRQGHGRKLMELVEGRALALGARHLVINSASDAVGFYEKLGWTRQVWSEDEIARNEAGIVQLIKNIG